MSENTTGHGCLERNGKGQFLKGISSHSETQFKKGQHWRKQKPHWNGEWLIWKYEIERMPACDIAKITGCTEKNIYYWMDKHGIKARSMSETRREKYWGSPGEENGMYGRTGEKNGRWLGGCSPERQSFYSSAEWVVACSSVWKRDNATCQRCAATAKEKTLHVHHKVSFSIKEKRAELSNLILLCVDCHRFVHSKKNEKGEYIEKG